MKAPHIQLAEPAVIVGPATIGFRLDADTNRVLAERAAILGVGVHKLARHYVLEMLQESEEREALRGAVFTLQQEIAKLRRDFAQAVETLLVSAGKVDEEEARTWVNENFR